MGRSGWKVCTAVMLIFPWGTLCSSCPWPCRCEGGGSLLNCSSVGPSLPPLHPPASVTALDLSHNDLTCLPMPRNGAPLPHLTQLHLGHNQLTHLSLCQSPPSEEGPCKTWAPALELLSTERNQLQHVPEGVCGPAALHTLDLSHNSISTLQDQELQGCSHLRELYLQNNLISTLHPLAFRELQELRVLDLSANALRALPVPAYLSLRSLHTQVEVRGNPWRCDCGLQAVRRWMAVASDGPAWRVVCAEPPALAGRDLLQLDHTHLTCSSPGGGAEPHQEVTAHLGVEILLPCRVSDEDLSQAFWWTPDGSMRRVRAEQGGGLMIRGVTERDQGLYVCVCDSQPNPAGLYAVRVRAGARGAGVPRGGDQADLALPVSLSVILTFLAAFVLGALTRPLLDVLWGKIRARQRPPATATPTATAYDNRGFSEREGSEAGEGVGLGGTGMPYYITVHPESDGSQTRSDGRERDTVKEEEPFPARQPFPRGGWPHPQEEGLRGPEQARAGSTDGDQSQSSSEEEPAHPSHTMEFEPIPDPQDLGIEELSSTGSDPLKPDHDPDHDPNRDPNRDPDHDPNRDPSLDDLSDPSHTSREELAAPFPAPDWTDSPWEPRPHAAQATPLELDADVWTDSGESFEFSDVLLQEASRRSSSLALQLKEGPWSPFHLSAAEQDPHDSAQRGVAMTLPPEHSGSGEEADAPWVIHVAGQAGVTADGDTERLGAGSCVSHDAEGCGHSPEVPERDQEPWTSLELGQDLEPWSSLELGQDSDPWSSLGLGQDSDPWSSLGLGQDPAGHEDRFGETDLHPVQHPTPADPPYPIKPWRSFTRHTIPQEDTPPPLEDTPPTLEDTPPPLEDTPPTLEDTPTPQEDTPPPLEDTPPPLEDTPPTLEDTPPPPQEVDIEGPMQGVGPLTPPSQGSQKQDWRRGGLFFQKRRVMDTFSAPPPGSSHLPDAGVTVETVTMTAGDSAPLRDAGEISVGGAEGGCVTSDPTSYFLFGSSQDKGSEA